MNLYYIDNRLKNKIINIQKCKKSVYKICVSVYYIINTLILERRQIMEFKINSKEPIYTQIMRYLKKSIVKGELKGGERILSVRECASELKVNPNTIQRAYTQLENEGLIYTQRGVGKFVVEDKTKINEVRIEMLDEVIVNFINESKELGVEKEDLIKIINQRF